MTIFGTRPEGIKMAPLVKALKNDENIECLFLNTAQHREMLDQVLDLFDLKADYDLDLMTQNQELEELMAKMLIGITNVLKKEKPDLVLVHGDTLTTLVGAQASFFQQIPVGHVEAGLRTHDLASPFPEEANRQVVGRYAKYHFAATEKNRISLLKENVSAENIFVVGNTVIDALIHVTDHPFSFPEPLNTIMNNTRKTVLMTTHRRENLEQLQEVYRALNRIIVEHEDVQIVFPVHKNPAVRKQLNEHLTESDRIHIVEPQDYETFAHLMKHSYCILTDSGGIQEEAPALGKPVLVARKNTERPEGVDAGTLRLCGTDEESVYRHLKELLVDEDIYKHMSGAKNPYGIGDSSEQIVNIIKKISLP